jgi:hypothetical protein
VGNARQRTHNQSDSGWSLPNQSNAASNQTENQIDKKAHAAIRASVAFWSHCQQSIRNNPFLRGAGVS